MGVGKNGGFLFGFGEQAEVDGGNFENQTGGTIFKNDDILDDVFNVEVILNGGGEGNLGGLHNFRPWP